MKKLFPIIGLILILLAGCGGTKNQVTIMAEPDAYTHANHVFRTRNYFDT